MENGFTQELARFGPDSRYRRFTYDQARRYCQQLAETHYENFSVATLLLPRRLMRHFHAVYAYCRWADDLGDETGGGPRALALLRWWRQELLRCYDGEPAHPVMVALQRTIRRFDIPPKPFLDLLRAFEQDQLIKRYKTFDQLADYCKYSANPVGRLVLYLCEAFDEERGELSDYICTGLQLANFWQDVDRDMDIGRVYLPAEDLQRFGYTESDLNARRFNDAFANVMKFEIDRARSLFHRGLPLVDMVPDGVRLDIELFARGGLSILDKIESCGLNVWAKRPALAKWEKASLLLSVAWGRMKHAIW